MSNYKDKAKQASILLKLMAEDCDSPDVRIQAKYLAEAIDDIVNANDTLNSEFLSFVNDRVKTLTREETEFIITGRSEVCYEEL